MADRRLAIVKEAAPHLREHGERYELCAYCPKMCRFACPVAEADARETLTPWGKMSAPFLALRGGVPLETAFETAWACTGCGHCTEYCAHGNDVTSALVGTRAAGVAAGVASPVTDAIVKAYAKVGNPTGRPSPLASMVPPSLRDDRPGARGVVFLPGCTAVHDEPATVRAAFTILERVGARGVTVPPDGSCCGAALWWAGKPEAFDEHAEKLVDAYGRRRTIVVADAGCAWALRELYPQRGHKLKSQVLHVSEWVAGFFRERVLKSKQKVKGRFLYHDPCFLSRRLGVVDEPRAVLASVLEDGTGEFAWNRNDTVCCGGGGLLPMAMPGTAARMAERRIAEAKAAGASVVTSCTTCLHHLRENGADAVDLLALVAKAL